MRWLALLFCVPVLWSCEKLSNRLHSQVLDCGEAAREGGPWIKVLDPQGLELSEAELLDARILELNADGELPPALPVSQKHCVNTRGASRLVIRSLAQGRSWSVVVKDPESWQESRVQLQDNSQARVRLRCPEPWIHNGRFTLPLEVNAPSGLDAWAFAPVLRNPDGRQAEQNYALQSSEKIVTWPEDWADGPGLLSLRQRNLLQNPRSALAEVEESCAIIVDRHKPILRLTPTPDPGQILDMQPGALLRVHIEDQHPATLQWCLEPYEKARCDAPEAWLAVKGEATLPMPDQGRWTLKARGWDAAGNEAEPLQQVIDVVRRDLIQGIASLVDQALAEKNEQGWEASISLLRALVDYRRLTPGKEQDLIRSKIINGILGASPYLQEFQRVTLPSSARRAWPLSERAESPWLIQSDSDLSLWSAQGHKLSQILVPLAFAADWSPTQKSLALGTTEELWVIRVDGSHFSEPMKLRWMDYKDIKAAPDSIQWLPGQPQMVINFPDSQPAIVVQGRERLDIPQRLTSDNNRRLAVSSDGMQIATVDDQDIVRVWQQELGVWTILDQGELALVGLSFAIGPDAKRLIALLKDGRLISWTPGVVWKDIDPGASGETPTESQAGIPVQAVQSWGDGSTGIMERGGRFYQWATDPGKTLQPLKFSGFDWQTLRTWKVDPCQRGVWMQDNRSLSYWEWQDGSEPGFQKIGDWPSGSGASASFAVACERDQKRFMTLTGNRVSFWSQRSPLPILRADREEVSVSQFQSGHEHGETLFTAGFDGVIRLWDKAGRKLQEWVGHQGPINELRYLPEWKLFASSAEDFTTRLWKENGEADAALSLLSEGAKLRDAALAFDERHMLTSGKAVIALWSQNSNRKELTITIPLQSGERAGPDSLVRLPGAPRILVRLVKGSVRRALVLQPDGTQVMEPGLPALEKLKGLEWTRDGARLALSDAQGRIHIYRYDVGRWFEEGFSRPAALTDLVFAPDGQTFAALGAGQTLVIGQLNQDQWLITKDIPLASRGLDKGFRWTLDSGRLVYAQSGQVFVRNRDGRLLHQFQAFPGISPLDSMGLSQDPEILAVGSKRWVRIIDFNLERLQTRLCTWLDAWIHDPAVPAELSVLCPNEG